MWRAHPNLSAAAVCRGGGASSVAPESLSHSRPRTDVEMYENDDEKEREELAELKKAKEKEQRRKTLAAPDGTYVTRWPRERELALSWPGPRSTRRPLGDLGNVVQLGAAISGPELSDLYRCELAWIWRRAACAS
jgi:hypothetical protein